MTGELIVDLYIVIVNYNTRELLRQCLTSVYDSQGDFTYHVCVVDNCSNDDSAAMVREEFPLATLIESQVNGGYAYANNLGLENNGGSRYSLLLNPDTLLPHFALSEMVAFMDAHPDAGAAGPRLVLQDGSLDLACRRSFPSPAISFYRLSGLSRLFPKSPRFGRYNLTCLDPDETTEVDSVVGAFMMIRSESIQQVGLLDEDFFMYGEDLDWAYRIKEAGWMVYYNADVTVLHYKRASSKHSFRAQIEFYRAMHLFFRKHYAADTPFWLSSLIVAGIYAGGSIAIARYWLKEQLGRRKDSEAK